MPLDSGTPSSDSNQPVRGARRRRVGLGLLLLCQIGMPAAAAVAVRGLAGWRSQSYPEVRGIRSVHLSRQFAHTGHGSLALAVSLDGRVPAERQGEAYVDLRYNPPADVSFPVNLGGHEVSAWFYAPPGIQGTAHNPNGARLFVKDSKWRSEYGPWTHLRPGHWNRLVFTPSLAAPRSGYANTGFDPAHVILLGVSVALGGGSTDRFTGTAFLDNVGWDGETRYSFED